MIDNFALYLKYLQTVIATTRNLQDHSTLYGKFTKLTYSKVLIGCPLFTYVLADCKCVSLTTQKHYYEHFRFC